MELLQEYCLTTLDVFRKSAYPKDRNEQTGWLSLLAVENVEEAEVLLLDYPWLGEIYRDMEEYLHNPKEVLDMFSEALRIMDRNTVQYMIEEQQKELEKKQKELEEKNFEIEQQRVEIERLKKLLEKKG